MDSTADAAFATDDRGRILAWNRAARDLLGYEKGQAIGARCWRLLRGADGCGNRMCRLNCRVAQAVRHREALHRFPVNLRAADGSSIFAYMSVFALRTAEDPASRAIIHLLSPSRCRQEKVDIGERRPGGHDAVVSPLEVLDSASALTRREREVLRFLADGSDTHEMAHALFISVATVRNHIQRILAKLGAHSRLAAVAAAKRDRIL